MKRRESSSIFTESRLPTSGLCLISVVECVVDEVLALTNRREIDVLIRMWYCRSKYWPICGERLRVDGAERYRAGSTPLR
jgi:hypothetical protein